VLAINGQGGKNQLRFTHVVAQILGLQPLELLVLLDGGSGPFLMNDVGQDGKLALLLDVVLFPSAASSFSR